MVENVLHLTFKDLKTKQKFSEKLLEARNLYKNLQNGISAGTELMKDIDKLEISAERFDSDPETPDECILSSAKNIHENIPGKCYFEKILYKLKLMEIFSDLDEILSFDPSELGLQIDNNEVKGKIKEGKKESFMKRSKRKLGLSKKQK